MISAWLPHTLKSILSPQFRTAYSKVSRRIFPDFIFRGDRNLNDFSRLDSRVHGFCSFCSRHTVSISLSTRSQAYNRSSQPAAPSTAVPLASPASIFQSQPLDEEGLSNIVMRFVIFTVRRLNRGEGSRKRSKRKKEQGASKITRITK